MESVTTKLHRIATKAGEDKKFVFTNLMHLVDLSFLWEAHRRIRKDGAVGIDGVSGDAYAENLMANLKALHERMRSGRYRAPFIKRCWIPKDSDSERPIGITTFEDKIAQKAVGMLLEAVYEEDFVEESYGFRPGKGAHGALAALRDGCMASRCRRLIDADIQGYFDAINHKELIRTLRKRVNDGSLIKLVIGWLKTGIVDGEQLSFPDGGSPQGGLISPIIANIYLHEALDTWFESQVKPVMKGDAFLVRYADDFVLGFLVESDAERVMKVLPKRFGKYGLTVHPQKSKQLNFRKPIGRGNDTDSFDFLGFTHYWGRSLAGRWIIKRRTSGKKLRSKMVVLKEWCKERMHTPLLAQWKELCSKLVGHYQYYGVIGNYKQLEVYYEHAISVWRRSLNRRNSKNPKSHQVFNDGILSNNPLPKPRIMVRC